MTEDIRLDEVLPDKKRSFAGAVRVPEEKDLSAIKPILEAWIRDSETHEIIPVEVEGVMEAIRGSMTRVNDIHYLVAEEAGIVLGIVGFRPLTNGQMRAFATTDAPAELINAYVDPGNRAGRGVGSSLIENLETAARAHGFKEVLLNSGPRYQATAWDFYTKRYGQPVGVLENFYSTGRSAPVWRKILN